MGSVCAGTDQFGRNTTQMQMVEPSSQAVCVCQGLQMGPELAAPELGGVLLCFHQVCKHYLTLGE